MGTQGRPTPYLRLPMRQSGACDVPGLRGRAGNGALRHRPRRGRATLALAEIEGSLMERYTTIINLTVAAVLVLILVASWRWRDQ
jgi:hypothetical protein